MTGKEGSYNGKSRRTVTRREGLGERKEGDLRVEKISLEKRLEGKKENMREDTGFKEGTPKLS